LENRDKAQTVLSYTDASTGKSQKSRWGFTGKPWKKWAGKSEASAETAPTNEVNAGAYGYVSDEEPDGQEGDEEAGSEEEIPKSKGSMTKAGKLLGEDPSRLARLASENRTNQSGR
jgi:hypothetical protein